MPFLTACPFCPAKMKVPDEWLGASFCCPRCGSNFTVAPTEQVPAKGPVRHAAPPTPAAPPVRPAPPPAHSAAPAPPPPPPPAAPRGEGNAGVPLRPSGPAFTVPESVSTPFPSTDSDAGPGWVNAWGGIAFSLACLGVLFAGLSFPRWVTITLAALGIVVALAGVVATQGTWRPRDTLWLPLGGAGSAALLLVALLGPSWLNYKWGMDFAVPEPDMNKMEMVSRDNKTVVKDLTPGDWIDPQTNAFRQGDVLVSVEGVTLEQLPGGDRPTLVIALRVANVGPLHQITYDGQGSGKHPAVVRDSLGKELARRDLGAGAKKAGQIGTVSVLPTHEVKDLIASEPPWQGSDRVDLELPAAAWGRTGVCKFRIPRTFIVDKTRRK